MRSVLPNSAGQARQLAPFVLLALLLHVVLLSTLHLPARIYFVIPHQAMEVTFVTLPVAEQAHIPDRIIPLINDIPAHIPPVSTTQSIPLATLPDTISPDTPPVFNVKQLMESAKSIARDEAIETEHQIATQEKKKLNMPIAALDQYLRQPHKELRLANGTLKIVTEAGAVCFQPVPYFAHDMPGLFGIPISCL
jgi:hypothetical protein